MGLTLANNCFAGHCDWRIPNIVELRTIVLPLCSVTSTNPCIDPIFGPTLIHNYWSSTTSAFTAGPGQGFSAWGVFFGTQPFGDPNLVWINKNISRYARAVRSSR